MENRIEIDMNDNDKTDIHDLEVVLNNLIERGRYFESISRDLSELAYKVFSYMRY